MQCFLAHHVNFLDHFLPPWIFALSPAVAALPYVHNFETFDFVSKLFLEVFMAPEPYAFLVSKLLCKHYMVVR
jgi:hypothetical protein